ncbi:MAG TPA: hypothetical protein VMU11_00370 [Verrucomicrobiae bacterium]|nr:hypothetical protein [Verrucomicrobiae bacterium]
MLGALLVFIILFHAGLFGGRLIRKPNGVGSTAVGLFVILAGQSVVQTALYYLGVSLGIFTDFLSLALALLPLYVLFLREETEPGSGKPEYDPMQIAWMAALGLMALVGFGYALKAASGAATTQSIRTPWPLLPVGTLAAVMLPALASWLAAWKTKSRVFIALLASLAVLSVTLIAPLVYSVGFGFDGFLHQASEKILLATGTLSPKPPYYIGQYVFVTWLARLTQLDLSIFDRYLVPLAAGLLPWLFLPLAKKREAIPAAALAFLPLASFIVTTPQAFAYLVGLMALIAALNAQEDGWHPATSLALSAWALAIHPLAGLPLALGSAAILISGKKLAGTIGSWVLALGATISVPLAFALLNTSQASVSWNFSNLWDAQTIGAFFSALMPPQNRVALWADWASMVAFLLPISMAASAGFAIWKDKERQREWTLLSFLALGMALAGLFLKAAGEFAFLIEYERGNYADRLFVLALLFLLPPAAAGSAYLVKRLRRSSATSAMAIVLGLASWHAAQAYNALPRFDASVTTHGWSVGAADMESARWIDGDAQSRPYTVLANQNVSAAAVSQLGFKRYAGDVFFYPIPTGGPLYQTYLEAVGGQATTDTIREAGTLGQSKLVYVVLNDYWWNADTVAQQLASMADSEHDVSGTVDRVFKFVLP